LGRLFGNENGAENGAAKKDGQKRLLGRLLGRLGEAKAAKKGSKNYAFWVSAKRHETWVKKCFQAGRAMVPLEALS